MYERSWFEEEAYQIAREAHDENFSSRLGTGSYSDGPYIYLYDNNPYHDPAIRERALHKLKKALIDRGFEVAGVARYPLSGEESEYTLAVVFNVENFGDIIEADRVLRETWTAVRQEELGPNYPTHFTSTGRGLRVVKPKND